MVVALQQYHFGSGTRCCNRRRGARRTATDHQHIAARIDRHFTRSLTNRAQVKVRALDFLPFKNIRGQDALVAAFNGFHALALSLRSGAGIVIRSNRVATGEKGHLAPPSPGRQAQPPQGNASR